MDSYDLVVTRYFSEVWDEVYTIKDGVISYEPKQEGKESEYAWTDRNTGFLDKDSDDVLMMYDNVIKRISSDDFEKINSISESVEVSCPFDGITAITYNINKFPDNLLHVDNDYKKNLLLPDAQKKQPRNSNRESDIFARVAAMMSGDGLSFEKSESVSESLVERSFTQDTTSVYAVNNGIITMAPMGANRSMFPSDNVGWLGYEDNDRVLMICGNIIHKIDYSDFERILSIATKVDRYDIPHLVTLSYAVNLIPDSSLHIKSKRNG